VEFQRFTPRTGAQRPIQESISAAPSAKVRYAIPRWNANPRRTGDGGRLDKRENEERYLSCLRHEFLGFRRAPAARNCVPTGRRFLRWPLLPAGVHRLPKLRVHSPIHCFPHRHRSTTRYSVAASTCSSSRSHKQGRSQCRVAEYWAAGATLISSRRKARSFPCSIRSAK